VVNGTEQLVVVVSVGNQQYTVGGLTPGVTATFLLRSEDTLGRISGPSAQASAVPTVQAPSVTAPVAGAVSTSYAVVVTGKAEAGAEIVYQMGSDPTLVSLVVADQYGNFSKTITLPQEGVFSLHFYARVVGQISSPAVDRSVTIDVVPTVPTGLTAIAMDTRVLLQWNRSTELDVVSYNVYRNSNLVPLAVVAQPVTGLPTLLDLALTNGLPHQYQVEAVDGRGNKSGLSPMMSVTPISGTEWAP
jgi:hypothetical protein